MQGIPESVLKDVVRETLVGMKFGSLEKVVFFFFYMKYAYSTGFPCMIRNSRKNKRFTEMSFVNLKCN